MATVYTPNADTSGSLGTTKLTDAAPGLAEEHFRTDHLLQNIGHRALSGSFVTLGAQAAKFALNFAAAAVLARLLSPKDFGLVGMVLGVTNLVNLFKELGLSTATVQRETITQQQVSNLFWINVTFSGVLAVISVGLAPLIARFYRNPQAAGVMLALSLTFLLTGSTVQHQALLTRQMRYSALALIDVTSLTIGFTIACGLAWFGFAYWALVAQQISYAASTLAMTWFTSRWRPSMPRRSSGVRPMLAFGAHLTIADFVGLFSVNSDSILLGRFFGAVPVGLYTRANVLLARPIQQVLTPMTSVMTPVLSRLQGDPERYRRSYMRAFDAFALVVFSVAAVCFALAKPMVLFILGPKWIDVVPLFSAFALVAVSGPISGVVTWLYESQGRGHDQLRNHTLAGAVTFVAYLLGLKWGPLGLIVSLAVVSLVVRLPLIYFLAGRRGPVSTRDLWIGFLSHLPCWAAVVLATRLADMMVAHAAPIVQILVCGPIGLGAGVAVTLILPRPRRTFFFAFRNIRVMLMKQRGAQAA